MIYADSEGSCTSFDMCLKFVVRCPPTETPTQKFKIEFSIFTSQDIDSSLVSFQMIFQALQSVQIKVSFPGVKNPKNPGIQPIYYLLGSF